MIKVALVDDHALLRNGLANVIKSFGNYTVLFEADNGRECIDMLMAGHKPDIILLDVNMPEMNGFNTAKWLKENEPEIKVLVLTMMDDDMSIIQMMQLGAKGYILKDTKPEGLKNALHEIAERGFYFNETISDKMLSIVSNPNKDKKPKQEIQFSNQEIMFLKLCCTEKSYKEIGASMGVSARTAETMRVNMFEKLETQSRIGIVMYAIRNGIIQV
ncbi:response regulator transcription factor [Limnovirga soli]|uniref:Response regulator n=1 Tax=Limnovirga soli TaxID=2656915 RepID=A0A8J8FES5_9BACT|nr:response regulator transcription factor [Limnovirga soli]NNV56142.1 response regulator [Limnovirga soli]